jgi:hypothetical protein
MWLVPKIMDAPTDSERLLKIATVLTCQPGLGWHRAMLFSFHGQFPAMASCVMALGDDGSEDRGKVHDRLATELVSIEDYLDRSEAYQFADDRLFLISQASGAELMIPPEEMRRLPDLFDLCENPTPASIRKVANRRGGFDTDAGSGFLATLPWYGRAFAGAAYRCDRFIVPFVDSVARRVLGFALLDNPYTCRTEHLPDKVLTRNLCDLFTPHLAFMGYGKAKWTEDYVERSAVSHMLVSESTDVLLDEMEQDKVLKYLPFKKAEDLAASR